MITRLKHIKSVKKQLANGQTETYYYHRTTGKRIEGKPGTSEFLDNYALAAKFDRPNIEGTVAGLLLEYKTSHYFTDLSPRSQSDYTKHLEKIRDKWGTLPLAALNDIRIRKDLLEWHKTLGQSSPRQADYSWAVFSRVVQFAIDMGQVEHHHLSRPGRLYKSERNEKIWLPQHVEAFMQVASEEIKTALIFALHTGQRQGDLIKLCWSHYDGQSLTFRQSKTGRTVYIPATSTLKNILDKLKEKPKKSLNILTNSRGAPWTSDGFRTSWGKAAKTAEIEALTFHDLRGTAITIMAEQGSTPFEIATITGHSLQHVNTILDVYASRTKAIAQAAILRFEKSWISKIGE